MVTLMLPDPITGGAELHMDGDDTGDGAQSGVAREGEAEVAGGAGDGGGSRGGGHGAKAARPSG